MKMTRGEALIQLNDTINQAEVLMGMTPSSYIPAAEKAQCMKVFNQYLDCCETMLKECKDDAELVSRIIVMEEIFKYNYEQWLKN